MDAMEKLEKVEQIRKRVNVGYAEAVKLLDAAGGDVLQALILHESQSNIPFFSSQWQEWESRGNEVLDKIKTLIQQGNVTRLIIRKDGRSVAELPVTAGVIGAILAPTLTFLGGVACLFGHCSIEVERRGEPSARFEMEGTPDGQM